MSEIIFPFIYINLEACAEYRPTHSLSNFYAK